MRTLLALVLLVSIVTAQASAETFYEEKVRKLESLNDSFNKLDQKVKKWAQHYVSLNRKINKPGSLIINYHLTRPWLPDVVVVDEEEYLDKVDAAMWLNWAEKSTALLVSDYESTRLSDMEGVSYDIKRVKRELKSDSFHFKRQAKIALENYKSRIVNIREAVNQLDKKRQSLSDEIDEMAQADAEATVDWVHPAIGTWDWTATCKNTKYKGQFTIGAASKDDTFSGSFAGGKHPGKIEKGKIISDTEIKFIRTFGDRQQDWECTLLQGNKKMKGRVLDKKHQQIKLPEECKFTADRVK